jgi:hypothetical protein
MHGDHVESKPHPCWWCKSWGGVSREGFNGLCNDPRASRVTAQPEQGCAYYSREPGSDDEPEWSPLPVSHHRLVWAQQGGPPLRGTVEWAP